MTINSKLLAKSPYTCNEEELNTLLEYYTNHEEKYKYELKIRAVERAIKKLNRPKQKQQWEIDAEKYIELTIKWEEFGCYFKNTESMTTWYYKEESYFTWFSSWNINYMLQKALEADAVLESMIKSKQQ